MQRLSVNPIGQIVTHEDLQALMECGYQVLGRFEIFLPRKRADEIAPDASLGILADNRAFFHGGGSGRQKTLHLHVLL